MEHLHNLKSAYLKVAKSRPHPIKESCFKVCNFGISLLLLLDNLRKDQLFKMSLSI